MPNPIPSASVLGRALRDARRRQGWTQAELAERAGVSQPTVSNTERGVSDASLSTLLRLASILGLELVLRERASPDPTAFWERP